RLAHDARDGEVRAISARSVGERLFEGEGRLDLIRASDVRDVEEGLGREGRGIDLREVERLELLDPGDDAPEVLGHAADLLVRERKARETGDVRDELV